MQDPAGAATYVCHGVDGASGQDTTALPEPKGENCANGGVKVQEGTAAPIYVCNGTDGTTGIDGHGATVTTEAPGANCAGGGVKVDTRTASPTYVCNGADGTSAGSPVFTAEPSGANCTLREGAGPRTRRGVAEGAELGRVVTGRTASGTLIPDA